MSGSRIIIAIIFIAILGALAASCVHYRYVLAGFYKLKTHKARLVECTADISVVVNEQTTTGRLYPDVCRRCFTEGSDTPLSLKCFVISFNTKERRVCYRLGKDWVGTFSYGGSGFVEIRKWGIVGEIAESCYLLTDKQKGTGSNFAVENISGALKYRIVSRGSEVVDIILPANTSRYLLE